MSAESRFRIDRLSIRNYKGIDELDVDFPQSPMADDPDVVALGSRNGVGKSSVLECCALLLAVPRLLDSTDDPLSIANTEEIVRAGEPSVEILGRLRIGNETTDIRLTVDRDGTVSADRDRKYFDAPARTQGHSIQHFAGMTHLLPHVLGHIPDPAIFPDGLLFHSFRRVYQSHLPPDSIFKKRGIYDVPPFGVRPSKDVFKGIVLRELMHRSGLLEDTGIRRDEDHDLGTLNDLIERYTAGRLGKLKLLNDEVDIGIETSNGTGSFTVNGLSSGQLEIISTLFLIWFCTRDAPSVVLIDEPELHLNAEWHGSIVSNMIELAPDNQYILATHSDSVMSSVSPNCRIILASETTPRA